MRNIRARSTHQTTEKEKMKKLLILLLCMASPSLLFASPENYDAFKGQNIQTLVGKWGQPDTLVHARDGFNYYVYSIKHTDSTFAPPSSQPNVVVSRGRAIGTSIPPAVVDKTTLLLCTIILKVNNYDVVVDVSSRGTQCSGAEDFTRRVNNPFN
jgi:hypothetical protein